jgi:hypothetical protein
LLLFYKKGTQEDLTSEQKKKMVTLAKILKAECKREKNYD